MTTKSIKTIRFQLARTLADAEDMITDLQDYIFQLKDHEANEKARAQGPAETTEGPPTSNCPYCAIRSRGQCSISNPNTDREIRLTTFRCALCKASWSLPPHHPGIHTYIPKEGVRQPYPHEPRSDGKL